MKKKETHTILCHSPHFPYQQMIYLRLWKSFPNPTPKTTPSTPSQDSKPTRSLPIIQLKMNLSSPFFGNKEMSKMNLRFNYSRFFSFSPWFFQPAGLLPLFSQTAASVSAQAHVDNMKKIKSGLFEYSLSSNFLAYIGYCSFTHIAYETIAGAGWDNNHCTVLLILTFLPQVLTVRFSTTLPQLPKFFQINCF